MADKCHAPAALPPGKCPETYSKGGGWVGLGAALGIKIVRNKMKTVR